MSQPPANLSSERLHSGQITVLHVDDDPDFADLTAAYLEQEDSRLTVETASSASAGLDRLAENEYDCLVSDYEMPGMNGLELFDTVREDYPMLPFILFTGKGSEEVASEALSAGVTDYFQKQSGPEQYELLAARVINAVEKARAEAERHRHLSAIETVREGIGILNADLEFVYVNDAYADLFGYDPEEMLGAPWHLVYQDEQIPEVRETVGPVLKEEGYWYEEQTFERADGSTFLGDHVIAVSDENEAICIVRDITESKERQRDLQFERDRFRTLFKAIPEPAVTVEFTDDGTLVRDVNTAFETTFGYDALEVIGEDINDVIVPDDEQLRAEARAIDEQAGAGEQVTREVRRETADGIRDFLFRSAPIEHDGEITEQIGLYIDITDRKQRERELERQNDRLNEFTSAVSHDLQGPLSIARGRLELAQEQCESPHLADVGDALDRMETLIDDLLTLAAEGERVQQLEAVDLAAVVDDCSRSVKMANATLSTKIDRPILADRSRLQQLLENLLGNAVEHGGENVTITVGQLATGFYVADDGPGLPTENPEQVFERGYSTTEGGTGFGLTIVREIVEAHGWDITVTESKDGGARFEITDVEFT